MTKYIMPNGEFVISKRESTLAWIKYAEPFLAFLNGNGCFICGDSYGLLFEIKEGIDIGINVKTRYEIIPLWIAEMVMDKDMKIKKLEEKLKPIKKEIKK